ncbi:MAG: malto-oligosyltrehalose synthase, partial [Acidimicrobiales bacterium]
RDKEVLRGRLADLCRDEPAVAGAVDAEVATINADPEALDALLERQNYRLAYWRAAGQELDYRRFFDIDSLVGMRVEDEAVFEDGHALVLSWLAEGVVDGLRIDHIDGLRDPQGYLERLRASSGGAWVVVEKILEPGERLRETWPVAGTTGYDFGATVTGLFMDPAGEAPITALWEELSGSDEPFAEVAHAAKHAAMVGALAPDLARLTALFVEVCQGHRHYRDYTRADLSQVLEEVMACLHVYRTYVGPEGPAHPDDVATVEAAVAEALGRRDDLDPDVVDLLRRVLTADAPLTGPAEVELRLRFQQVAGPVMAKGVEDTALYSYDRLVVRNEVGSDPSRWATPVGDLHTGAVAAQESWPEAMLTTSTHDTKRSEDVRARLAVLSEAPGEWARAVTRWRELNSHLVTGGMPDPATEYLAYQTLVGAWPVGVDRVLAYMQKAAKEAKTHTSWTDPDPDYDAALEGFVRGAFGNDAFMADAGDFVAAHLREPGWVNSLAQALLRLTMPGVPDTYQGCECWDYSLVDPDNRRPVDFDRLRRLLAELGGPAPLTPEQLWARRGEGLPKLAVTHRALTLRRAHPSWFGARGDYSPLTVAGDRAGHLVAFARAGSAVTVVPRLVHDLWRSEPDGGGFVGSGLSGVTVDLPAGRWQNVLTGEDAGGGRAGAGELLARFPVALLARVGTP